MTTPPVYERSHSEMAADASSGSIDRLRTAIAHGEPVMAVLGTDERAVLAVIDGCVGLLVNEPIRIVRVRGSQNSPLTLPRIVEELGAGERGGPAVDDDELIVRVLARPRNKQDRVLFIIEQAQLTPLRTLTFLQVITTVFGATTPRLQLLFAGHPKFTHLIERDELAGLQDRLGMVIQVTDAPMGESSDLRAPRRIGGGKVHGKAATFVARHRKKVVLSSIALVTIGLVVIAGQSHIAQTTDDRKATAASGLTRADPPATGMATRPAAQSPGQLPGTPPASPLTLPPQAGAMEAPRLVAPPQSATRNADVAPGVQPGKRPSWPTGEQLLRLREEFDHFFSQTESGFKRQGENERSRLFKEFLQWNYGASGTDPDLSAPTAAAPSLSPARVTLNFRAGSTGGKAMARRFATTLRPLVTLARTRSATEVSRTFELRYFALEDEGIAQALAQKLQAPDVTWAVRIIPDAQPAPMPHTFELWIPLR